MPCLHPSRLQPLAETQSTQLEACALMTHQGYVPQLIHSIAPVHDECAYAMRWF